MSSAYDDESSDEDLSEESLDEDIEIPGNIVRSFILYQA